MGPAGSNLRPADYESLKEGSAVVHRGRFCRKFGFVASVRIRSFPRGLLSRLLSIYSTQNTQAKNPIHTRKATTAPIFALVDMP